MNKKNKEKTKSKILSFKDSKNRFEEKESLANEKLHTGSNELDKTEDKKYERYNGIDKNKGNYKSKKLVKLKDVKSIKESKLKKTKKKLDSVDIVSIVVIGMLVWVGSSLTFTFVEQQVEISVLKERKLGIEKQIKQEEKELKKLQNTLNQMDTPQFIEKQAREQLGMIKPGETVYIDLTKKKN